MVWIHENSIHGLTQSYCFGIQVCSPPQRAMILIIVDMDVEIGQDVSEGFQLQRFF